jgi:very-short-patch-repair endonuclease
MKCKICNLEYKTYSGLSNHVKKYHKIDNLTYYIKYHNLNIPECPICGKEALYKGGMTFYRTCGDKECLKQISKECWTKEKRKKQAEIVSNYLKTNKSKWGGSYRNSESLPEKKFKEIISTYDLDTYQWYKSEEFERLFEIDFAIPSLKIGFEINGNQHYNSDGSLTEYYQNRHDIIESKNWKLIEIPYLLCFNEDYIRDIIEKSTNGEKINYIKPIKRIKRVNISKQLKKEEKIKRKEEEINKIKNKIINSEIDFSKFGWVEKVSKIIGISPQKTGKWMNRNMSEFYEKCYKRGNNLMAK